MSANPNAEAYLRGIMPGLSDEQYMLRAKLVTARDYANARISSGELGYHEWQLFYLAADVASGWVMHPGDDDSLSEIVDYCRSIMKSAVQASKIFG